jgi:phosphatidylserine decarboxylase
MKAHISESRLSWRDEVLFLATNRIPRQALSQAMGTLSKIESPLLARVALSVWRIFDGDFRLDEAKKRDFRSIHDIFTRELRDGVRPVDQQEGVIVSPCDALVGEHGEIDDGRAYQAKGFPYRIADLLPSQSLVEKYRDGVFVTLRLKSSMYHRFHSPTDCTISDVFYITGDRWNVHPPALKKIEGLYCKNERAVIECLGETSGPDVCIVAVAAILVSSIRIHCLSPSQRADHPGCHHFPVNSTANRGTELGYFEHGSTIVLFAPEGWQVTSDISLGGRVSMGQALLQRRP